MKSINRKPNPIEIEIKTIKLLRKTFFFHFQKQFTTRSRKSYEVGSTLEIFHLPLSFQQQQRQIQR